MELKVGQTWTTRGGNRVDILKTNDTFGNAMVGNGRQVYPVNKDGRTIVPNPNGDLVSYVERVYIAGPMTGIAELNFPAFHAAAAKYRERGCHVENPAEINPDKDAGWVDCMRADIPRLLTCDTVVLLAGWEDSRGANLEHHIAVALDMRVVYPT